MSKPIQMMFPTLVLVLAGCTQPGPPAGTNAADTGVPAAAGEPENAAVVDAFYVSPGKPAGPIGIRHEPLARAQLSLPLEVELVIASNRELAGVTVQLRPGSGLVLTTEPNLVIERIGPGEPARHVVTVTPVSEGRHRLSVIAQARVDGFMQAATHSVDIEVGSAGVRQQGPSRAASIDEDGEAIVILPAE